MAKSIKRSKKNIKPAPKKKVSKDFLHKVAVIM